MSIWQSILLGLTQGLAEFLPVSSSGHLVFFQSLFGLKEPPIFFDVMLHLATLLAIILFFRRDIWKIIQGVGSTFKKNQSDFSQVKLLSLIILATLPTGLMGFFLKDWFESFFSAPRQVGGFLFLTGLVLFFTRFIRKEGKPLDQMKWSDALLIGIAQGIAILPGISRSGATISTSLFLGLNRELSGRFSFLLSIPAILGATLLEIEAIDLSLPLETLLIGTGVAFVTGMISLTFLMKIIRIGKLFHFSYYCCGLGIGMIIII